MWRLICNPQGYHSSCLVLQSLTGGIVNRTLRVVHNGDFSDAFIVRINGTVGEKVSFQDKLYQIF